MIVEQDLDDMESAYGRSLNFADKMVGDFDPLIVATSLCTVALSLYRTVLGEKDFNEMMDTIYSTRDQIRPFMPPKEKMQ